jgi:CspA family cold shock protein
VALGTVRYFDPDRGFGYITPDDGGNALAVHREDIVDSPVSGNLMLSWRVEYEAGSGAGGLVAREVAVVEVVLPDEDEGGRHDAPHADPGPFAEAAETR